jgi:hypothetical protein
MDRPPLLGSPTGGAHRSAPPRRPACQVVGALLDAEAEDSFINNLILSVRSLIPVEALVEEVERRNKLKMLNPFLEQLVSEGSKVGGSGWCVWGGKGGGGGMGGGSTGRAAHAHSKVCGSGWCVGGGGKGEGGGWDGAAQGGLPTRTASTRGWAGKRAVPFGRSPGTAHTPPRGGPCRPADRVPGWRCPAPPRLPCAAAGPPGAQRAGQDHHRHQQQPRALPHHQPLL